MSRARKEIPELWIEAQEAVPEGSLTSRHHLLMQKVLTMLKETFGEEELKTPVHLVLPDFRDGNAIFKLVERHLRLETVSEGDTYHIGKRNNSRRQSFHTSSLPVKSNSSPPQGLAEEGLLQNKRAIKGSHELVDAISSSANSSSSEYEYTVIISCIPINATIPAIRESLLAPYKYKYVKFVGRSSNKVVVTFYGNGEAERAAKDLDDAMFEGERIRTHLETRARGTSMWAQEVRRDPSSYLYDSSVSASRPAPNESLRLAEDEGWSEN